eukprot:403359693
MRKFKPSQEHHHQHNDSYNDNSLMQQHISKSKSPMKRNLQSSLLNPKKRVIEFTNQWNQLLDDKFVEKSSNFNQHYSKVIQSTLLNNSSQFPQMGSNSTTPAATQSQVIHRQNYGVSRAEALDKFYHSAIGLGGEQVKPDRRNIIKLGQKGKEILISQNHDNSKDNEDYNNAIAHQNRDDELAISEMKLVKDITPAYEQIQIKPHKPSQKSPNTNKQTLINNDLNPYLQKQPVYLYSNNSKQIFLVSQDGIGQYNYPSINQNKQFKIKSNRSHSTAQSHQQRSLRSNQKAQQQFRMQEQNNASSISQTRHSSNFRNNKKLRNIQSNVNQTSPYNGNYIEGEEEAVNQSINVIVKDNSYSNLQKESPLRDADLDQNEVNMNQTASDIYGLDQTAANNQSHLLNKSHNILEEMNEQERQQLIKEIQDLNYFTQKNESYIATHKLSKRELFGRNQFIQGGNFKRDANNSSNRNRSMQRPYSSNVYQSSNSNNSNYQTQNTGFQITKGQQQQYQQRHDQSSKQMLNRSQSRGLTPDFNHTKSENFKSTANLATKNLNTTKQSIVHHPINNDFTNSFLSRNMSSLKSQNTKSSINDKVSSSQSKVRKSQKSIVTNIKVVDEYYKNINNDEEIESIKFMNEFKRLFDTLEKLWKANPNLIPQQEQDFVLFFLNQQLFQNQSQNSGLNSTSSEYIFTGSYSKSSIQQYLNKLVVDYDTRPLILLRVSQYIQKTQKYIQNHNKLQSLIAERESAINRLKNMAQSNNLNEFCQKDRGPQMLVSIRDLSLKIISTHFVLLALLREDNINKQPLLYEHDTNVKRCYLCKLKYNDNFELSNTSQLFIKLLIFIEDFLSLQPKENDLVKHEIQQKLARDEKYFTLSEIAQFERICKSFKVKESSKTYNSIQNMLTLLKEHDCGNQQVIIKDLCFKNSKNVSTNKHRQIKQIKLGEYQGFFKFIWNLVDDANYHELKREDNNKMSAPIFIIKDQLNQQACRENFQSRAQNALSQLRNLQEQEENSSFNNQELNLDINDRDSSSKFISINDMKQDATFRKSISLFLNNKEESQINGNLEEKSKLHESITPTITKPIQITYETLQDLQQDSHMPSENQQSFHNEILTQNPHHILINNNLAQDLQENNLIQELPQEDQTERQNIEISHNLQVKIHKTQRNSNQQSQLNSQAQSQFNSQNPISQSVTQLNFYNNQDLLIVQDSQKIHSLNHTPPRTNSTYRIRGGIQNQKVGIREQKGLQDRGLRKNYTNNILRPLKQMQPPKIQDFSDKRPNTQQISKRASKEFRNNQIIQENKNPISALESEQAQEIEFFLKMKQVNK